MSWSFRIAEISGIPIKLHVTFFIIILLGAWQWAGRSEDAIAGALFGAALMLALFLCVTLHELGHSLTARAFGIQTREILLLPLGGVAQLSKNPDQPAHELWIALAGPIVNVVIAFVLILIGLTPQIDLFAYLLDGQGLTNLLSNDITLSNFLLWLLSANVSLVLFNMIPAFPLDGGRVLRALLAMGMGFPRATRIASAIGQFAAIALGLFGLLTGNLILALVAVFIFVGATQETAVAESKVVLTTRRLGDAYNRHVITLQNGDRLSRVVDYILTSYQPDFAVLFGKKLLGIVTRDDVMRALASQPYDLYVSEVMKRDFVKLDANLTLDEARDQLAEQSVRVAAVYDGENFLGLISMEDIQEAFSILMFNQRHVELKQAAAA
ncbi:MAG: site-2 protease family protein [Caldilineaceae bacterium]|jgi:Zn-dependent protease/predicted transcriptional regulator